MFETRDPQADGHPSLLVYTIGHSNHSWERFGELLTMHGIEAVADVRSVPRSGYVGWANQAVLARQLPRIGIRYVYFGDQLGGKPERAEYAELVANLKERRAELYAKLAQTAAFQTGVERTVRGAGQYQIALMCSEEDPLTCHRHHLIAPALRERGVAVQHIRRDGQREAFEELVSQEETGDSPALEPQTEQLILPFLLR